LKKRQRKRKHYREEEWKCISTNKNFVFDLRKSSPISLPDFIGAKEKIIKIYVTGFTKRDLPHTSNFHSLTIHNSPSE